MPERVLGIDILPRGKGPKKFAGVLLSAGGIILDRRKIRERELVDYITKNEISTIGIDNIWEIREGSQEIRRFLIETNVDLIQVTGKPGAAKKISYLAEKHNLHSGGKLSPFKTAEVSARLVLMGLGAKITAIKDQTKISVTRARSLGGAGGQRQAGFERSISSMVQSVSRDIKRILRRNDLPFDFFSRKKKHGLKSGHFLVYSPHQKVKEVVKELETEEVRVHVEPVEKKHLTFLEPKEELKTKRLFCGIDPGRNVGLALLDLSGNLLGTFSKRGVGVEKLIGKIYEHGRPVVIATDVSEVPHFVEQIKGKCNSKVFHPKKDIPTAEKWEIVRELGADVGNTHERDALVAAFMAYTKYKDKFSKIDKITSYLPIPVDSGEIKERVIGGETIAMATSKILSRKLKTIRKDEEKELESSKLSELKKERNDLLKEVAKLQEKNDDLREWISELEEKLKERKKRIEDLEWKIEKEKRKRKALKGKKIKKGIEEAKNKRLEQLERTTNNLRKENLDLKKDLRSQRKRNSLLQDLLKKEKDEVAVKVLESLTKNDVRQLTETFGIKKGDVVLNLNSSSSGSKVARTLVESGISAIVVKKKLPIQARKVFEKENVPILSPQDFPSSLSVNKKVKLIPKKQLEQAIEHAELRKLPERKKQFRMLKKSIEEYRNNRR